MRSHGQETSVLRRRVCAPRYSFQILHLLAHLLDQDLQLDRGIGRARVGGFGTERVRFTIEFLHQEIKSATNRFGQAENAPRLANMRGQAIEFLVDIDSLHLQHDFLFDATGFER